MLTSIGLLLSEPNPDDGLMCEAVSILYVIMYGLEFWDYDFGVSVSVNEYVFCVYGCVE